MSAIRSLAHRLVRIPVLSRAVHIVAAIYRLPEIRGDLHLLRQRPWAPPAPPPPPAIARERFEALEGSWKTHLPALLDSIAAVDHRVSGLDQSVRSIPMSLRDAKRERVDHAKRLAALEQAEARIAAADARIGVAETTLAGLASAAAQDRAEHAASVARIEATVATGLEPRLADAAARLQVLEGQARTALERADQSTGTLAYLLGRVEFVRRELMFELRYGSGAGSRDATDAIEPRIVNVEKVEAARTTALRLNLGSGHIPLDGYVNVDLRELPTIDVVSDVEHLPFADGEVDEIMSAHMLEHFPQEQLRRTLLPYWFRLLKPGGRFRAVVPDAEAMMREYARGRYPYAEFREVMFGGQDYDGDFHYNMFSPGSLDELLREAGFDAVEVVVEGRRNGACYEFEIVARKPPVEAETLARTDDGGSAASTAPSHVAS